MIDIVGLDTKALEDGYLKMMRGNLCVQLPAGRRIYRKGAGYGYGWKSFGAAV